MIDVEAHRADVVAEMDLRSGLRRSQHRVLERSELNDRLRHLIEQVERLSEELSVSERLAPVSDPLRRSLELDREALPDRGVHEIEQRPLVGGEEVGQLRGVDDGSATE